MTGDTWPEPQLPGVTGRSPLSPRLMWETLAGIPAPRPASHFTSGACLQNPLPCYVFGVATINVLWFLETLERLCLSFRCGLRAGHNKH